MVAFCGDSKHVASRLFLAVAVFVFLLGVECLGVEKIILKIRDDPPPPGILETEQLGRAQADRSSPLGPL